jgi:coenzyme F420-reducing hydrogenase gamma subunit
VAGARPKLAVWKFASCDGCQLSLLDLEDELLAIADAVEIAYFREVTSNDSAGPFDISLIDGSISTPHDLEQIREVRRRSTYLVVLGACATFGGIQALRNFASVQEYASVVYAKPEYVATLEHSTGVADHVPVDLEVRGCPPNPRQILEAISAFLHGRKPAIASHSVCVECKRRGNPCVLVTGTPCLGPITHDGCGALCPTYQRGCYGCFGPMETPNTQSLARALGAAGVPELDLVRALRSFNANAPAFRDEAKKHE